MSYNRKMVVVELAFLLGILGLPIHRIWGEEFTSIVQTKSGIIKVVTGTDLAADYPTEPTAIIYLTPAEGSTLAHAVIVQGTTETHFSGKKITYFKGSGNYILEGEGRIEQGSNYMYSPIRIEYDSAKNWIRLFGQPHAWAKFQYVTSDGPMVSEGREIHIFFADTDGKRTVKRYEVIDNQSSIQPLGGTSNQSSAKPPQANPPKRMRKLSAPH